RQIGEDIRFIKTAVSPLNDQAVLPWARPYFWWVHTFPWFLWSLFYGWQRRRTRLNQDAVYAKRQKAHGIAQKRLRQAKNRMGAGDTRGFYAEVQKALYTFISDRLGIATTSLPMDEIIGELQNHALPGEALKRLRVLLEECDLARFSPSQLGLEQMKNSFAEAETMIEQLERARKKKPSLPTIAVIFLLLAGINSLSWASTPEELFDQANSAYENQKYEEAINGYRQLLQQGIRHGAVYYNLGNAYLKSGSRGNAVLNYEKGLRLQPRDTDIKANLNYINKEINITGRLKTQTKGFLERISEALTRPVSQRELSGGLLASYWLFVIFLFLWTAWLSRRQQLKPWLIVFLSVWFLSLGLAGLKSYDLNQPTAVVLEKEIVLRAGPGEDFPVQATVPEGTQVRVLRYAKGWMEVRLGDLQGWILQGSVERI
ncbi:MAG: hypothetical protein HYS56_01410, partial [Candidatus Omnitrophica bacterium]|nr:hypothetical protein [Candidatus Omnitrophota bacterium]